MTEVMVLTTGAYLTLAYFFTGRVPFLSPNRQCQSTEWKKEDYLW